MRIIALCKTFGGEEWIEPMVLSIYPFVDKIVFVNSEVSWTGRRGNTCKNAIVAMQTSFDALEKKIISLNCDTMSQDYQCQFGYDYIKDNLPCDYVLLIDTDEIYDSYNLFEAIKFIQRNPFHEAYRVQMATYIKSPYYRVEPREPLEPVAFIHGDLTDLGVDARCCGLPYIVMTDSQNNPIFYHHFVYVRKNFNTILEKIISSHVSENVYYSDMSEWIPNVWNKLPIVEGNGFHPAIGYKENWKGIIEITKSDLPEILRDGDFEIMRQFTETNK